MTFRAKIILRLTNEAHHDFEEGALFMVCTELFHGFYRISLPIPRGGFESFLDGWLIMDEARGRNVLMETGPASAAPELFMRLEEFGSPRIDYLLYTHIHLDHAGGAGHFIARSPNTKVLAPAKGRPHLIDPARLAAGSRASLGGLCDVYGEPLPVPAENMLNSDLEISGLTVIDTPGHAPHHSSYIYELDGRRILFAGEAAGCWFRLEDGSYFTRPATPHKFFYDAAMDSLGKLMALDDIDLVCFPHSGWLTDRTSAFERAKAQMELWLSLLSELPPEAGRAEAVELLLRRDPVMSKLKELPEAVRKREKFFIGQSADGYLGWIRKSRAK